MGDAGYVSNVTCVSGGQTIANTKWSMITSGAMSTLSITAGGARQILKRYVNMTAAVLARPAQVR
jgi:hypothetical protein